MIKDINQLEDILKTLRSEREAKRARLTRRMDELRVAMNQANESMRVGWLKLKFPFLVAVSHLCCPLTHESGLGEMLED